MVDIKQLARKYVGRIYESHLDGPAQTHGMIPSRWPAAGQMICMLHTRIIVGLSPSPLLLDLCPIPVVYAFVVIDRKSPLIYIYILTAIFSDGVYNVN